MDNLISRQQAVDVLKELTANGTNKGMISGEDAVHRIEMLPPAQPEPCEDTVSRKDCLKALSNMMDTDGFRNGWAVSRANVECMLKAVPSVTPKQRTGKWIKKHRHYGGFRSYTGFDAMGEQHTITVDERAEYDDLYCSKCGARSADNFLNFCPNCGADMRGVTI